MELHGAWLCAGKSGCLLYLLAKADDSIIMISMKATGE